jgi:hypothetical protein
MDILQGRHREEPTARHDPFAPGKFPGHPWGMDLFGVPLRTLARAFSAQGYHERSASGQGRRASNVGEGAPWRSKFDLTYCKQSIYRHCGVELT